MMLHNEILGKNLVAWREHKGLKMEVAARELGVSTATWGHWETGRRFTAMKQLSYLAEYIGVPPCRLLANSEYSGDACLLENCSICHHKK